MSIEINRGRYQEPSKWWDEKINKYRLKEKEFKNIEFDAQKRMKESVFSYLKYLNTPEARKIPKNQRLKEKSEYCKLIKKYCPFLKKELTNWRKEHK